jgi:hypothetical protein
MGLSPMIWGSQAWHFIHCVAMSYPENPTSEDKERYLRFFNALGETLPCEICAQHFRQEMDKTPPRMQSRKDLFEWTVDVHNAVNKRNGKRPLTYAEAIREVESNVEYRKTRRMVQGMAFGVGMVVILFLVGHQLAKKK